MRRCFILATVLLVLRAPGAEVRHPNILYLLADQWRAQATGYAGDPNVHTPNLDRLSHEGTWFRNAVSVCPVCTPYRAALMTGRFPTTTGMFLNDLYLPQSELCMAQIFRAAGYSTGYIGKWHLDGHGRQSYIPPGRRHGWGYWKAAECDHNYNHSHYYTDDSPEKHYWPGYDAFAETADAQQYLREHAGTGQPFILMLAFGEPHFPYATAPAEYKALYAPEKIRLAPNVPESMQKRARRDAQGYYAHCTALDQCIGELLSTLAETGLESNTVVVFTADHGEMLGAQGCPPTMKQVPWNESAHVPFLLRYPAIAGSQGRVVNTPLATPDILPTLLSLAGVRIPKSVQGEDLSRCLRHPHAKEGRAVLYMAVAPFEPRQFRKEYRAIRTRRYTYVRGVEGPWLLFDDQKDPYQMENLVGKPEARAVQERLEKRLWAALKGIGDDFRPAASYVQEWGYEVRADGAIPDGPNAKVQTPGREGAGRE